MDDRELTEALARLGLDRRNHRAVALLPLVEVAWADGRVQRAEKRLIGEIAQRYGLEPGDEWLQRWLKKRPTPTTFLAARTVLLALMARSGRAEVKAPDDLADLLDLCVAVAEAAGGLFGLAFTYEQSERECIQEIAHSLQLGPALPQQVAQDWEETTQKLEPAPGIGDQVTVVRRIPQRKARPAVDTDRHPRPAIDPDPATARLTRPHRKKPKAATPVDPSFVEDDPTTPYFEDLEVLGGAYVVDGDDED